MTPDPNFEVRQMRLRRGGDGARKHGLYAKDLTPEESAEAHAFEASMLEAYDLDSAADLALLRMAARAYAMANRPAPETERGANVVASRVRLFTDLMGKLALTRQERKKGDGEAAMQHAAMVATIAAITKKREGPA